MYVLFFRGALESIFFCYEKQLCWLWQYGLWSFQAGGTKLERFLPKNQHTETKLFSFENWFNGEVSKIKHHFRK